ISQQTLLLYRASVAGNNEMHLRRLTVASATEPATLATDASLNTTGVQSALCADPLNGGWVAAWTLPADGQIVHQSIGPDGGLRATDSVVSAGTEGIALVCERPQPVLVLEFDEAA